MRSLWLRADGGSEIGIGHVVRSIALAEAATRRGIPATFVTDTTGIGRLLARRAGFEAREATSDGAWCHAVGADDVIIFDGYHLMPEMHAVAEKVRSGVRMAVIDDFGIGEFPVDVAVCPNPPGDLSYALRPGGVVLAGPQFAPVRAGFRERRRRREPGVDSLLLSFGGADLKGLLRRASSALSEIRPFRSVRAVVGPSTSKPPSGALELLHDPRDMAAVMDTVDAAVVAAGSTVWEACTLGLPIAAVPIVDNQLGIERILRESGAALLVTSGHGFGDELVEAVAQLACPSLQSRLAAAAMELVDGLGAERVLTTVFE